MNAGLCAIVIRSNSYKLVYLNIIMLFEGRFTCVVQ